METLKNDHPALKDINNSDGVLLAIEPRAKEPKRKATSKDIDEWLKGERNFKEALFKKISDPDVSEVEFLKWLLNERDIKAYESCVLEIASNKQLINFLRKLPAAEDYLPVKNVLNEVCRILSEFDTLGLSSDPKVRLNEVNELFKKRFDKNWDVTPEELLPNKAFFEIYRQLALLPDCFVLNNSHFDRIIIHKDSSYAAWRPGIIIDDISFPKKLNLSWLIDSVVSIHEVGHSVDSKFDGSDWYKNSSYWYTFDGKLDAVDDMEKDEKGWGDVPVDIREELKTWHEQGPIRKPSQSLKKFLTEKKYNTVYGILNAPIWTTISEIFEDSKTDDYYTTARSRSLVNGKYYTRGYGQWFSFSPKIMESAVTPYSLHSPEDWFAEQFAYYFKAFVDSQPDLSTVDNNKLTNLHGKLVKPWIKKYFDDLIKANSK